MLRKLEVERELREARSDKFGISITPPEGLDFGVIEPENIGAGEQHKRIGIHGLSARPYISLTDIKVSSGFFNNANDESFVLFYF